MSRPFTAPPSPVICSAPGVMATAATASALPPWFRLPLEQLLLSRDVDGDLENLETWPRVELEGRDLDDVEERVGEMEDAEELEDRDVDAVETTDKHKHIRCPAPAVWNASLRRCITPAAPAAVATCVSLMVYNVMTGQCIHPAATAPVPQCVAPMVYDAARRMCVRPATAPPAPQCAAPLVYNPVTRQCTMPTTTPAPAPAPAPVPLPVLQCVAPLVYNPTTRTCVMPAASPAPAPAPVTFCVSPMVYNPATRTCIAPATTGTATAFAKPSCALGEMAYCAKTSTNYVAYYAVNPLCHADGVNMVFCAAPARVMAVLQVKTFASANRTAVGSENGSASLGSLNPVSGAASSR
ncbi:hypothetical protein CPLU01_07414 [Colletotrichum plurivorum]|uniref:Uncharacterized protein n=1 Tax=Colletotrichum plurivorum TaxID=2175906 RepID=A0A8H6NEF6_9PEZI|nr:hypothetical protein CPLU01_07414 [Colletotrichum plurivorum]